MVSTIGTTQHLSSVPTAIHTISPARQELRRPDRRDTSRVTTTATRTSVASTWSITDTDPNTTHRVVTPTCRRSIVRGAAVPRVGPTSVGQQLAGVMGLSLGRCRRLVERRRPTRAGLRLRVIRIRIQASGNQRTALDHRERYDAEQCFFVSE